MGENRFLERVDLLGNRLVDSFHVLGLFVIGGTIVWSAIHTYVEIMLQGRADLHDVLLLFIYLELGAMVGVYFKTRRMPVRFLIYVAITALTRLLTIDIKDMSNESIVTVTGAILLLTTAALIQQFGSARFSWEDKDF